LRLDTDTLPRAIARPAVSTTDGAASPDPTPVVPAQRGSVGRTLHLRYLSMPHTVARLDTTGPEWVLYFDTDSPAEDHCWALLDVLRIVTLGPHAAPSTTPPPTLRLVRDDNSTGTDAVPARASHDGAADVPPEHMSTMDRLRRPRPVDPR